MCTEIRYVTKENGEITSLGGVDRFFGSEQPWGLTRAAMVRLIESGKWSFFVNRETGEGRDRVGVVVARRNGQKYLRTDPEGQPENNLVNLPAQDPVVTDRMPGGLSSGLPGARTPRLQRAANEPVVAGRLGVFTDRLGPDPLDHLGPYPLLPARTVFVRFVAPFSNRYEVRVNGEAPLYEAPAVTSGLPDPLEERGWFAVPKIGYLGAFTAATPVQIDRDFTVYEMRIRLPEELVESEQVSILIAQLSLNPNCLPPGSKSEPLTLELRRSVGGGGGVADDGTGTGTDTVPPARTSGTETVSIGVPDRMDSFKFSGRAFNPELDDALITSVQNSSRDVNGDPTIVHFNFIEHVDKIGTRINRISVDPNNPTMRAGQSVGDFRDMFFNGTWTVRVTGISAALLDPRRIQLSVTWRKP